MRTKRSTRWSVLLLAAATTSACAGPLAPLASMQFGSTASVALPLCDPIGPQRCMVPFPNDYYTVADATSATGRRINFQAAQMPVNSSGVSIDPTSWNRNDGFSPGSAILVAMPGADLRRSGVAGLRDIGQSLRADAPVIIVDTVTGERWPYWGELDAHTQPGSDRTVILRPARNFTEGHRYVVALRRIVRHDGSAIAPSRAFAAYRDHAKGVQPERFARVFANLRKASIPSADLQVAWDFTVASAQNLAGRILAMRDDAFRQLGTAAPQYSISSVVDSPDPRVLREIQGTLQVPLYLDQAGQPGASMVLDANDVPVRQAVPYTADFRCVIPASSTPSDPSRVALYGHGLLGSTDELHSSLVRDLGVRHNVADCAVNWIGLSEDDVNNAITALNDFSHFHTIADRLQQSFLNFLFLGRLVKHANGFSADPAFQLNGKPLINRNELYFDGNSQGAIAGGAVMSIAQDFTRGVLGEAGMNYSTLLHRSVDFDEFQLVLDPSYPNEHDQLLGMSLIQMLWDRGETDGYAEHITSHPYPNTPEHKVLLLGAVGDHQVTEWSLQVEARTLNARGHRPYIDVARQGSPNLHGWGIAPIPQYPYAGNTYYLWDTGSPLSPIDNLPARDGHDPHDDTPNIDAVEDLKSEFLHANGTVSDVCNGGPCQGPPAG